METNQETRKFDHSTTIGVLTIGGVFIALFLLLWKIGLFNLASTQSGAQVVGAALGLLGVIGTATVTLVGYLLKRSFDAHSLRLQESTEKRLELEGKQNQKRLDLEAAIQAVGLMSTQAGDEAPISQKSGALFALVTLDQIDLALALVYEMWAQSKINSTTAVWVIDKALQTNSRRQQMEASNILSAYKHHLYTNDGSLLWPECLYLEWRSSIDFRARRIATRVLLEVLIGRPKEQWKAGTLTEFISILQNAIAVEEDINLKASVVLAQECLLRHVAKDYDPGVALPTNAGFVTFAEMQGNLAAFEKKEGASASDLASSELFELVQRLEKWGTGELQIEPQKIYEPTSVERIGQSTSTVSEETSK